MTDRHIFPDHTTLVFRSLRGLVASHPYLNLIPSLKVVYRADHDPSKVSLICGGGSGHEPGTVGHVGRGLLSASVAGDVFASPSARQVGATIKKVHSDKGVILIITNYTGDNLHFGLARLMAQSEGIKNVELVVVGDDVSVPRSRGNMVGRRCLAGITLVCKILGAGSEADMEFQDLVDMGRSLSANTASICAALDHCHVPGRSGEWHIEEGRVEIGLGLHNETGVFNIAQPSPEEFIKQLLDLLLKQDDPERSFVHFEDGDDLVLLVNNQGGMSALEIGAVVDEVLTQLESRSITPVRILSGPFMGSMNMPGISLSLLNLSNVVADCSGFLKSTSTLLNLLDAPHNSPAWPATSQMYPVPQSLKGRKRADQFTEVEKEVEEEVVETEGAKLLVDGEKIRTAMKIAADDVLTLEPQLTRWDTIVGDGDCGETCALGAKGVLKALDKGLGSDGDLVRLFRVLTQVIDDSMGGTLGAIFSIFLAGLTTSLIQSASSATPNQTIDPRFFGQQVESALETLKQRTAARVGHRTVMDALIPFGETLSQTGDLKKAVEACKKGGEGTVHLEAKLGRATYVGQGADKDGSGMPPDPGAMAFVTVVEGILKAFS
ncbi:dihydroxyacetone kinase [Kwoniella newhampshirensis]|uniref:Dihydroxyacetone kinase n=1 Tax=Kwoniella newhampshirensis TaxID=1651941 RepID=A0AAW0YNK2_9TREE